MLRQNGRRTITAILAGFMLLTAGSSLSRPARAQAQPDRKALFERRCGGCHALDRDKEGPRLGGVYGRTARIVWKEETLDRWLTDTEKLVPNNDMTFHVEQAGERSEIIAYLKQNGSK